MNITGIGGNITVSCLLLHPWVLCPDVVVIPDCSYSPDFGLCSSSVPAEARCA